MKKNTTYIFLILLALSSCNRIKEEGNKLVGKTKSKTKEAWSFAVQKTFNTFTSTETTSFKKVFHKSDSLNVRDIKGVRVDFPAGFYYTFLKYKAEKTIILNFIENQPTELMDISDSSFHQTDSNELFEMLSKIEKESPNVKAQLGFFFEIRGKNNLEFYRCNKYPHAHILVFDTDNGIVYHQIEKYWD